MMMVIIYVPPPLPAPSLQGRTAVLPVPTLGDACRPPVPGRPRWFLLLSLSFLDSERCEDGDGLVFISEATVQGLTRSRCQDSFALKKKKKGMTSSAHFQGFRPMENSTVGAAAHVLRANGQLISPEAGSRSAEPSSVRRLSPRAGSSLEWEPTTSDAVWGSCPRMWRCSRSPTLSRATLKANSEAVVVVFFPLKNKTTALT